jgi:cystathionine beta-lyase/cystathionine gamma-synthase
MNERSYPYGVPSPHYPVVGPISPPLIRATAHAVERADTALALSRGERHGDFYPRLSHSNGVQFESLVAAREGADGAVAFSSGMAAMHAAIMAHCAAGDRILVARQIYGGTEMLCREDLPRFGVTVDRFDALDAGDLVAELVASRTTIVVLETPINPTLRLVDLRRAAAACREHGALLVLDGTFGPPPIQRALAFGVDLLVHSATKYYGGHSDVLAGAVVGRHDLLGKVAAFRMRTGGVLGPDAAWLLCRSSPTMDLRLAEQQASALEVARGLEAARARLPQRLGAVFHPGLPEHPDHALAQAQMNGGPCLVSFAVEGGEAAAREVFERLRLVARAPSLGGVESVASLPCATTHAGLDDEERARAGIPTGLVRISIGVEGAALILDDLLQAIQGS